MHHPITIEKQYLKLLAVRIMALKRAMKSCPKRHLYRKQQMLAGYKKQYRNRFFAYCIVRRGENHSAKGPIMSLNSRVKLNPNLVSMYRTRLLTKIVKAQSDYIDSLILKKQHDCWHPGDQFEGIDEAAPIPEKLWDKLWDGLLPPSISMPPLKCGYDTEAQKRFGPDLSGHGKSELSDMPPVKPPKKPITSWDDLIPLVVFFPDSGGQKPLYAEDFETDSAGNLHYTVTEPGTIWKPSDNRSLKVRVDDTINRLAEGNPTPHIADAFPEPVHQDPNGGWYFWDETWAGRQGPYSTEKAARRNMKYYCESLDR